MSLLHVLLCSPKWLWMSLKLMYNTYAHLKMEIFLVKEPPVLSRGIKSTCHSIGTTLTKTSPSFHLNTSYRQLIQLLFPTFLVWICHEWLMASQCKQWYQLDSAYLKTHLAFVQHHPQFMFLFLPCLNLPKISLTCNDFSVLLQYYMHARHLALSRTFPVKFEMEPSAPPKVRSDFGDELVLTALQWERGRVWGRRELASLGLTKGN